MPVLAWLLWTLFPGTLGGPVQHATWSETDTDAPHPAFYFLPMFQQSAGPLVAPEFFWPGPHRSALPAGLPVLLLPPTRQQQSVPGTGTRAVEVWCGIDEISVRVDRFQLRSWALPTQFRLGWCEASRTSLRFLYFHSGLTECGGQSEVAQGRLVYTFSLRYTPRPQGSVIRVVPLNLPIHCHYNSCLTDSSREGSSSQFLMRDGSVLTFSVDSFFFQAVSQVLYVHCSMSVSLTTSHTSKSCNYNKATGRWEELDAPASLCSCCLSMCADIQDSIKNTVSSAGWFIERKSEEKPRMKVPSFQAEEGKDWLDQGEGREERREEHLKVQTFPKETKTGTEEEKETISEKTSELLMEKKEWRHSPAISQQDEVMEETESQLKELETDGIIVSDQPRSVGREVVQAREDVPGNKNGSVGGLSTDNMSTNASRDGSASATMTSRNSMFGIASDNTSNHGFAENVSTAAIPITKHVNMITALAERFTPNNGRATFGNSEFGTVWDSKGSPGPLGQERAGRSGKMDALLWLGQVKSVKSLDTKSDRIPEQLGDSVNSKGPRGDDVLHSIEVRGSESDQSAQPAVSRAQKCVQESWRELDFDCGIKEDEAFNLDQLTGAVKPKIEVQGLSGGIISSGSVNSEQMYQNELSHSAEVTVTTILQDSESSQMSDRGWGEVLSGWGLQTSGYVVEQPSEVEELRQEMMDDF
ncbi:uncharacterized protein AB9X84_024076 isoform 2-T2 [Acanthopagrus schlegelii]